MTETAGDCVSLEEAAAKLGTSVGAVHQRLKGGGLDVRRSRRRKGTAGRSSSASGCTQPINCTPST